MIMLSQQTPCRTRMRMTRHLKVIYAISFPLHFFLSSYILSSLFLSFPLLSPALALCELQFIPQTVDVDPLIPIPSNSMIYNNCVNEKTCTDTDTHTAQILYAYTMYKYDSYLFFFLSFFLSYFLSFFLPSLLACLVDFFVSFLRVQH
jgi:hypothetical protein